MCRTLSVCSGVFRCFLFVSIFFLFVGVRVFGVLCVLCVFCVIIALELFGGNLTVYTVFKCDLDFKV